MRWKTTHLVCTSRNVLARNLIGYVCTNDRVTGADALHCAGTFFGRKHLLLVTFRGPALGPYSP